MDYKMKQQLETSATSIASNIAEACAFDNPNQTKQRLMISIGESNEVETRLRHLRDTGKIDEQQFKDLQNEVKQARMGMCKLKEKIEDSCKKK